MLVSEQIDAMRALGTDPVKKLVVPRIVALVTMAPALTIICDLIGVIGGLTMALLLSLVVTPTVYSLVRRKPA